ncbi:hypothetical protein LTR56_021530 [Elasticomyces elasticus]|nr:hypothetical protein LTR56_021530 [Elasticomyces elasticus]KAK3631269.1 hypothetical protein LTR22_021153 [Elasticomyces elasticus]KAK4909350.1 hypothetical protein LTR49_021862 [Elasticomyces elasticus]KAK5749378.1 hypothetical protein LTS12_020559 [Elasticomyces elasticus]
MTDFKTAHDLPMDQALQTPFGEVKVKETDTEKISHSPGSGLSEPATAETGSNDMAATQCKAGTAGLLDIAAELRNTIYELVFTADLECPVNLFAATPPSRAITRACRQTRNQAKQMYVKAYRAYWTQTAFCVDFEWRLQPEHYHTTLDNMRVEDLAAIRYIHMKMRFETLVELVGSRLAENMTTGRLQESFARVADGRWCLVTGCDAGKKWSYCWRAPYWLRQLGYRKYEKSDVFRPVSVDELSAIVGPTLPAESAQID